jgi:hypothetical protein
MTTTRFVSTRIIRASALGIALLALGVAVLAPTGAVASSGSSGSAAAANEAPSAAANTPFRACKKKLRHKGRRYSLVRRAIGCRKASKLTRRILRTKRPLRRWSCNLSLPQAGRCSKRKAAFIFVRVGR